MTFNAAFLSSSYLLIFLGLVGLFFTEEISPSYLILASSSLIAAGLGEFCGRSAFLRRSYANAAMLSVFFVTLFSIFLLKAPPLQELTHFLLSLQTAKLLSTKQGRDWLQIYLLSFFSLVGASALSVEIFFAAIFVCYLFTAPWVLVLFHLRESITAAGKDPNREPELITWPLFRLVGKIGIILLVLTLFFFVTLPRMGLSFLAGSVASGSGVMGFSDDLTLGQVSEIQKNSAVAIRVSLDAPIWREEELYWRGIALDHFDGRKWQKSKSELLPLARFGENYLVDGREREGTTLIRQKIILEPIGSPALFALGKPVAISGRLGHLFRDPLGNIRAGYPFSFQVSYEVLSHRQQDPPEDTPRGNFLQLPSMDSRIIQLTEKVTQGLNEEVKKARALERYLKENYRYSLEGLPTGEGDPLAAFLFVHRQANCEYFSSALALMLRRVGIPARVVNGYLGGEWNTYGDYYLIRQSNAHSWVEAYIQGSGWLTLDPTPPLPKRRSHILSGLTHFLDYLRMRWYRYVVNFGLRDQYQLFTALKQPRKFLRLEIEPLSLKKLRKNTEDMRWGIGLALLLALAVLGWRHLSRLKPGQKVGRTSSHPASERYRRFLIFLRKQGITKKPGETPDDLSRRPELSENALVSELISLYQGARFSGREDISAGLKRMDQILKELEKQGSAFRMARIRSAAVG